MNKAFTVLLLVMIAINWSFVYAEDPKPADEKDSTEQSDIEKKVQEIFLKKNIDYIDDEKLTKELVALGKSVVPILKKELNNDDYKIISLAVYALNKLIGEKALSDTVKAHSKLFLLKHKYFETDSSKYIDMGERTVLYNMFQLIVVHKDKAIPHLIKELEIQKKNEDLKYELIIFIMSIDTKKAIETVKDIYKKETSKEIKMNILVDWLYKKDEKNKSMYLEDVYKLMNDKDMDIKCMAIRTLGLLNDLSKIDKLIELSLDNEYDIRIAAMYALSEIGTDKAVNALIKNLEHDCELTRSIAACYIGEIVTDDEKLTNKIVKALIETLNDKDDVVRFEAILALSSFRDLSIIPHLEKIAKSDSDDYNREVAQEVIEEIKKNKKEWDESQKNDEESDSETD